MSDPYRSPNNVDPPYLPVVTSRQIGYRYQGRDLGYGSIQTSINHEEKRLLEVNYYNLLKPLTCTLNNYRVMIVFLL